MSEVHNLKQVLAQTQAVERMQEAARRQGDLQQQQAARHLVDRVDIQGRHVEEAQDPEETKVDPEAKGETEKRKPEKKPPDEKPRDTAKGKDTDGSPSEDEDEGKGRVIDLQA